MTTYQQAVTAGYQVDPDELSTTGERITACTALATDVALPSDVGDAPKYGHDDLFAALSEFALTWQIAVETLTERADAHHQALLRARDGYDGAEVSAARALGS